MIDWLTSGEFLPHGHCYFWRPDILWLHVLSDGLIALAYFSIPVTLVYFLRRRPDVPFPRMIALFALFIVFCGVSHVFEIVVIWDPVYGLQGIEKALTALVSVVTAIALIPAMPRALAMRSPAQLQQEVDKAVEALRETQDQLIENEKLVTLGGLVAGLSHEVSSPIGNAVMAASTLTELIRESAAQADAGKLTRSGFAKFMASATQASDIALRNLRRADELIGSFKQVAVDQSSGERRRFNVREYIDEILLSLHPRLKRAGLELAVECPDGLIMDSYPGAFSQILSNLINNSLLHAFPGDRAGKIRIRITTGQDKVTLEFSDDGVGVAPENMQKIFEPFFTTRRNSGGSGLGLSIVQNLVTQTLHGSVDVESAENQGTTFRIEIPANA